VRPAAWRLLGEVGDRPRDVLFARRRLRGLAREEAFGLLALDGRVDDEEGDVDAPVAELGRRRLDERARGEGGGG